MSAVPRFHGHMGLIAHMGNALSPPRRMSHNEVRLAAMEPRIAKLERYFNADTPA